MTKPSSANLRRHCAALVTALALGGSALLPLSAADTLSSAPSPDDQPLSLEAFTVTSDKDVGFVAASSLAGGRMKSDLADTPVAYSVQTREFLDALNLTSLDEALEWAPNTTHYTGDNAAGIALGGDPTYTTRGIDSNPPQRNFFQGAYNFDTYNVERFDYTRGPNSILFGPGTISGAANVMSKFARVGRTKNEIALRADSHGSTRATLDFNQQLGSRAAVRVNLLKNDGRTWRHGESDKSKGIALAVTANLTKTTQLKVSGEYDERSQVRMVREFGDLFSAWTGVTYDAPVALNAPSSVTGKFSSLGVVRLGSSNAPNYWIYSPDRTMIMNYAGSMATEGYSTSGQRPLDGKQAVSGALAIRNEPFVDATHLPASVDALYGLAVQNSHFVFPSRQMTNLPTTPVGWDRYTDAVAVLSQTIGDSIYIEVAGDANRRKNFGNGSYYDSSAMTGISHLMIDINKTLPNGQPNPHFLDPYQQAQLDRRYNVADNEGLRASIAYMHDFSWLGVKANTMAGTDRQQNLTTREAGVLPVDPDARQWARGGSQAQYVWYRVYFNDPVRGAPPMETPLPYINPQTGASGTITPVWALMTNRSEGGVIQQTKDTNYWQGAAQLSFLKNHLILLGGFRVDSLTTGQRMGLHPMAYPAGFVPTGTNYLWRPPAPADWQQLTYQAKNAAGQVTGGVVQASSRPYDSTTGQPLPQYANDRFQDDYSPPSKTIKSTTKTIGGVVKLVRGLSLYTNYAQTFNPGDISRFTINFDTPPSSTSEGLDLGLRYSLPGGKVNLSVSRFTSKEKNYTTGNPPGYSGFNTVINANPVGDDNPAGTNKRGLSMVPDLWYDVSDRNSSGYEFEVTANPTRQWRLTANYGTSRATQTNAFRQTKAWLDKNDAVLHQILADAGVVFDAAGLAVPSANASIDATSAANSWNGIQSNRANWVTGTQTLRNRPKYTANAFTDYTFATSRLKGLSVGGGVQFRGPMSIGFRGADTIVDPNNPAKAIDDPTVDAYTTIYNRGYSLVTGRLGYRWALRKGQSVNFNLTVSNLLNYDHPNYTSTTQRPVGDDLSTPARRQEYFLYNYIQPRTYTLTVRYDF